MPNKLDKIFILPLGSLVEVYPINCPSTTPTKVQTMNDMQIEERMLYGWGTAREKKHYCLYNMEKKRVVMHGIFADDEPHDVIVIVLKRKDLI